MNSSIVYTGCFSVIVRVTSFCVFVAFMHSPHT